MKTIMFAMLLAVLLSAEPALPQSPVPPPQGPSVTLTWTDGSNNEDGFKVERSINGSAMMDIGIVGPNVTTYVDQNMVQPLLGEPDAAHCYRVKAFNKVGDSGPTNTECWTVLAPLPPPTAPADPSKLILQFQQALKALQEFKAP